MVDFAQRSGIEITIRDSGASATAKVIKRSLDDVDRGAMRAGSGVQGLESSLQSSRGTFGAVETALTRIRTPLDTLRTQLLAGEAAAAKFRNGLAGTGTSVTAFGKQVSAVGTQLTDFVTVRLLTAGGALFKFAVEAAESESLFAVAMKGMADEGRAFSERLQEDFGVSAFSIRENLANLQQLATGMGFSEEAAFDLSSQLTLLAEDMASFRRIRPEDAFAMLRSGMTGEIEPLKALGIIISDSAIEHEAFRLGLIKTGETMSQQQKVIARFSAILRQTQNDQGDLARAAESPTNKLRRMANQAKQAAIELGTALLPAAGALLGVAESLGGFITDVVQAFVKLSPEVKAAAIAFTLLLASIGPVLNVVGILLQGFAKLVTAIAAVFTPVGLAVAALTTLAGVGALVIASWEEVETAADKIWKNIEVLILSATKNVADGVVAFADLFGLVPEALQEGSEAIGKRMSEIQSELEADNKSVTDTVIGVYDSMVEDVVGSFNFVKDKITDFFFEQPVEAEFVVGEIESLYAGAAKAILDSYKRLSVGIGDTTDKSQELIETLEIQIDQQERLFAAQGQGSDAVDEVNDLIETQNTLRRASIDELTEEGKKVAGLIQNRNDLRRATDDLAASQEAAAEAAKNAQEQAAEAARAVRDEFRDAFDDATASLEEFVVTGKFSLGDFLEDMRRKLAQAAFDRVGGFLENALFGAKPGASGLPAGSAGSSTSVGSASGIAGGTIFGSLFTSANTASVALTQTSVAANQNATANTAMTQAATSASNTLGSTFVTALGFAASGLAQLFGGGGSLSKTGQILSTVVGLAGSIGGAIASGGFSFGSGSGVSTTGAGAGSPFGSGVGSGVGGAPGIPTGARIPFPNRVPRFASGGSLTVPGFGPADSRAFFGANVAGPPVVARVSPGERISFTPRGGNDNGETDELLRDVRSLLMQIAGSTRGTERALAAPSSARGFNQDGFSSAADAGVLIQNAVARNK